MGNLRGIICRLCLQKCVDSKAVEAYKDVLDILLLKINLAVSEEPVICTNCAAMLLRCSDFKKMCFYTRDCIVPYLDDEKISKLDLRKVYISKHENVVIPNDYSVCGFCLGVVKKCTAVSLDNDDKLIEKYLPELDLNTIEEPLICATCYESFRTCVRFVMSCLIVEEKVMEYRKLTGADIIEIADVPQLTSRDILKVEEDGNTIDVISTEGKFCVDMRIADGHENDGFVHMEEQKFLLNEDVKIKTEQYDFDSMSKVKEDSDAIDVISTERKFFVDMRNSDEHKNDNFMRMEEQKLLLNEVVEIKTDDNDFDGYPNSVVSPQQITKKSGGRKKSLISEKGPLKPPKIQKEAHNLSDAITYPCDLCSYRTEYLEHLENHQKIHEDLKEIMYCCNCCSYKTKYKKLFKNHILEHHNSSEVAKSRPYRCSSCPFRAKYYRSLRNHMITHTDISEATTCQCDSCPFRTKYKRSLRGHMITHADVSEATTYQCVSCPFRTKYRINLQSHMVIHRDISETTMYECDACLFRTKYKRSLRSHMTTHTNTSETTTYQCYSCSFKTNHKSHLRGHMLQHKNPPETPTYQCSSCSFKTKRKQRLDVHMSNHKDPLEVTMYQCTSCPYQTKYKRNVKQHFLIHKKPSEVTMHRCDSCSFCTNYKGNLQRHMATHKHLSSTNVPV